jgi:hypothetical protein
MNTQMPDDQVLFFQRPQQQLGAFQIGLPREEVRLTVDQHLGRRRGRHGGARQKQRAADQVVVGGAIALHLFEQAGARLFQRQPGHQLVQVVVDAIELAGAQREVDRDQLVLDLAARRRDDGQQLSFAQLHELQVLDDVALRPRRLHHDRQVRQLAQQARRPLHDVRDVAPGGEALANLVLLDARQAAHAQQHVDVVAKAALGGEAPPRRVGVLQQPRLLEIAHHRTHGRGRHLEPIAARHGL